MVFTADALLGWTDFPKGLRVLLIDDDSLFAVEIKSKLEEMDYIVSLFCNENEALTAISREPESFHVAIVEVSPSNQHGRFKFLEMAKDLPTIMTSNIECLGTMMKCITLGAAEFLQKPLSEDKLKNIWQHVVHKAFNAGGSTISKSLKPIKETVVSILQLQQETNESDSGKLLGMEQSAPAHQCDHELSTFSDKFPAPSTPQLKQGCRLLDDGDCQDQPNCSMEQERVDLEEESNSVETTCNNSVAESKSVETTCNNSVAETSNSSVAEVNVVVDQSSISREAAIKEEHSVEPSKTGRNLSNQLYKDSTVGSYGNEIENQKKVPISKAGKTSRKKMKVDWTPELHKQFVQAVEQLGVDQAIPSRILELMKVEGLTRHNVASHLQKYRMHRRHIVPKDEDRRWQQPREPMQRVYVQKPIMAYPTYLSTHGFQRSQHCPVWGHPSTHPSGIQMWGHPGFPTWHHHDSWPWKTRPAMQLDAWGCPVMPPSQGPCSIIPQHASGNHSFRPFDNSDNIPKSYLDCHQDEEVIDKVVKEAMSKPWLPLPLGLKPPSIESVLSELHRQGISNIPPHSHR